MGKKKQKKEPTCRQAKVTPPEHPGGAKTINIRHISRDHTCCTMPSRTGTCNYRKNGESGSLDDYEVHHILCHSSMNSYPPKPKKDAQVICAWLTIIDFCLNQKANVIPLPLRSEYEKYATKAKFGSAPGELWGKCCHNWDHNCKFGYTWEVTESLKETWQQLKVPQTQEKCPKPPSVKKQFDDMVGDFKDLLKDRGMRNDGTKVVLKQVIDGKQKGKWWRPFSMANTQVADSRSVSTFGVRPRWDIDWSKLKITPGVV
jgi:hypothetical protein